MPSGIPGVVEPGCGGALVEPGAPEGFPPSGGSPVTEDAVVVSVLAPLQGGAVRAAQGNGRDCVLESNAPRAHVFPEVRHPLEARRVLVVG
jgi:hypothetical protein